MPRTRRGCGVRSALCAGDGSQVHSDNGHDAVPGLLIFEPNATLKHWPAAFTSYKSSLVGGYLRAVHTTASAMG